MTQDLPIRKAGWKLISLQAMLLAVGLLLGFISITDHVADGKYASLPMTAVLLCMVAALLTFYRGSRGHGMTMRALFVAMFLILVPVMVFAIICVAGSAGK